MGDVIGHIGNVQTLWDIISGAVQYWPSALRGAAWVIASWWFPIIASFSCLLACGLCRKNHATVLAQLPLSGVWMLSIRPIRTGGEGPQLKERRQKLKNLLAKGETLAAAKSSPGFDMNAARLRNEKFIDEVRADINRLEGEENKSGLDTRVTYEETSQIIEIFKNAPRVKVVVTSLSVRAGEEFRAVMEQPAWFCKALQDAGVNVESRFWETLGSLPDGTNIWWKKNAQNNDMVERIIRATAIKGLHPTEVQRPVSAGDSEIELMIGRSSR